jgi:antitoxin (DNA-binding transcriptional repressor) of toxin-antitoxin stability system
MKEIGLKNANLEACIHEAQRDRVVITRNGKPLALIVGVEGLDKEQLQLGSSDRFWELIAKRRTQKTITRSGLEQRLREKK